MNFIWSSQPSNSSREWQSDQKAINYRWFLVHSTRLFFIFLVCCLHRVHHMRGIALQIPPSPTTSKHAGIGPDVCMWRLKPIFNSIIQSAGRHVRAYNSKTHNTCTAHSALSSQPISAFSQRNLVRRCRVRWLCLPLHSVTFWFFSSIKLNFLV